LFKLLDPNPPIRAKLRTGIKEKGRPKAVPWFVSEDPEFHEHFGETPTRIEITFPFSDPEQCLRTSFEYWRGNGVLKCWSSDGEHRNTRDDDGDFQKGRCKGEDCHYYTGKSDGCSVVGRLRFKIPELSPFDLFQVDTRSWNTMNTIAGALQLAAPVRPDQHFALRVQEGKGPKGRYVFLTLEPLDIPTTEEVTPPEVPDEQPQEEPDAE